MAGSETPDLDRFLRTRLLLGDGALDALSRTHVLVVGLGAVGSFVVEALARAGIGRLTLVDGDAVEPTNINRQLYALHSTLGESKAALAAKRCADINPDLILSPLHRFITPEETGELLDSISPDLLIDAIDTVDSKTALLIAAYRRKLPVFSSMGAARKTDPTQIRVGDISETRVCPLAKIVRRRLNAEGITTGIRCAYSTEPALPDAPDAPIIETPPSERAPLGSFICVTGTMGLVLAREAIIFISRPDMNVN